MATPGDLQREGEGALASGVRGTAQQHADAAAAAAHDDGRARRTEGADGGKDRRGERSGSVGGHNGFGVFDVLRMLLGGVLLSCALSYFVNGEDVFWGWRPWFTRVGEIRTWLGGPVRLTDAQLLAYDGSDPKKPIYVGLDGIIYDVSVNRNTYGPGGSYHFFAGKDAARAFITGCFREDLTGDLRDVEKIFIARSLDDDNHEANKGLSKAELKIKREKERRKAKLQVQKTLDDWHKMYRGEKDKKGYFRAGEIVRKEGWLEKQPIRTLCPQAEDTRPMKPEGE